MDLTCPSCGIPLSATATDHVTVIVCSTCAGMIRIPHDGGAHSLSVATTLPLAYEAAPPPPELDTTASFEVETSLQADERRHSVAPAKIVPGTRFRDYEIIEEIARGGMGVVYKARQIKLNRTVALKVIRGGRLPTEEEVRRFYLEAEAAAHLDHPGIVPVYEVGHHQGQHFYSMGFVPGTTLAGRLAAGPLPPREAAELLSKTAAAVAYAHDHGVIHRDLKPSNILLDAHGEPRVADFGLAKRAETDSELTAIGQAIGTPSYMPPEQAAGRMDEVGPLADVYSLGATLYCLTTGRPPFQAANADETRRQVIEQEPVPPRQLNGAVDRDLETICLKCLEKEPQNRYASAQALADDLDRFLDHRPIRARPVGPVEKSWRWCKRNPAIAGLLTATAALVVAVTTVSIAAAIISDNALRASQRAATDLGIERDAKEEQRKDAVAARDRARGSLKRSLPRRRWINCRARRT